MDYTMITLPDDLLFSMEEEPFVDLARRILEKHGSENHYGALCYQDSWIGIRSEYDADTGPCLRLEVTRQKQDVPKEGHRRSHLSVSNPTTMVNKDGKIIRHHGEYCYLVWHMHQLMGETITAERY